ncbi:uncharacterized protein LOC133197081 [Saccostrea echinata]|uniref:uncharacterized protein LOC133197081 n=1 Tax=Saccostrea echinata TaxID=191078 RepID=UPI002A7F1191|nr:uncharacterized protein LOC133197081 [Saccostrea echinata]
MFRCLVTVHRCIKNNEILKSSLKSCVLFVKGTNNACTHSARTASFHRAGLKAFTNHQHVHMVYLSYKSPNPFAQPEGTGSDPCDRDYKDGVDREFRLVYALGNIDKGYMFIAGIALGFPLLFLLKISYFFYKEHKELEYASNDLWEIFNNCVEIYNHLPVSFEWLYVTCHITLFGGLVYFLFAKNTIGRLYYSAKQDRYIAIVYKYGFKRKIEFSRKDIERKPVFYEKYIDKLRVDIGKKKKYYVYENCFRDTSDRNRFFSDIASHDYIDELNK